jgi:endonuclease I
LDLQIRAGPSLGFFSSNDSEVDEYRETGAKFSLEYARGITMWLSCTYERGWRSYNAYREDDPESIFSDYTFDRLTLFVTAKIWNQMGINSFFNHEPERHKREGDDSTITLFSFSLTYAF